MLDTGLYVVSGGSMEPTYHEGQRVLIERYLWRLFGLQAGAVVVFDDPRGRTAQDIKRVAEHTTEQGSYYLLGDNTSRSTDSRAYGAVPTHYITGRVIMSL